MGACLQAPQKDTGIGAAEVEVDAGFLSGHECQQHQDWCFGCHHCALVEACGAVARKSPASGHRHAHSNEQVLKSRLCLLCVPSHWDLTTGKVKQKGIRAKRKRSMGMHHSAMLQKY